MGVRSGDDPCGTTTGGAPARAARRWRPAALVALAAVAAVAALLPSGAGRDSHPPQGSETAAAIAARPGVEQVEPLGGKLYPPRYDTLDYQLNQLVARHEGREAAPGTPAMDGDEGVAVVVLLAPARAGDVAAYLRENGVALPAPATGVDSLAAAVPIALLPGLAGRPGVQRVMVDPPVQRLTHGVAPHGGDFWQDAGWKGSGVKIGILDSGFSGYSSAVASDYVPTPAAVRCFRRTDTNATQYVSTVSECETESVYGGGGDLHGTATAELVYDVAPEATYYLARIERASQAVAAINWFVDQGVEVVNVSIGTRWEGPGDGTTSYSMTFLRAVDAAVTGGAFVAMGSGNSGESSWFGDFRDSDGDGVMGWSDDEDECNAVSLYSFSSYVFRVRWEDNWRGSTRDLDVYLKQGSTVLKSSEEAQRGGNGHNPYEQFTYTTAFFSGDYCLVIEQKAGDDPGWVQVLIEGAGSPVNHMEHRTEGYAITSPGETANTGALTVGATAYNNTNTIQSYSSRGPTPDGRIKPDIVGVDAVRSEIYRGNVEGTSFAAPHVTGLAALVKQRNPDFTPAEIATYLKDNAVQRGEPRPNNTWGYGLAFLPHIGPVITGDPRSGIELTANTEAVDDIDGIPASPTYTYQWIRVSSGGTETNIVGATSPTYTPVQADVGRTLKVKVSFQDNATTPNDEEQTSVASLRVIPAASANRAATGVPTVSGTLRVAETLTASTSAIRDADGLSGVIYKYQWVRVDAGTDTDISGAEGQTYVLQEADQGKTVKVRVTFDDDNRNAEERESAETGSIGVKANIPPAFPSDEDGMREVEETRGGEVHVAQDIGAPVAATDPDSDTLTYSIKDGSDLFEIDSSGQLRTKAAVDYEIPRSHRHTIVVQVTDSKDIDGVADTVIDDTITVTITVTNVDDPPVITGLQTVDWPENAAGTIATYGASDPEGEVTLFDLVDTGDYESFAFLNDRLSFKSTALPDFEGKQQYHIELGATTDPFAPAFDITYAVTINITDVPEPPEITLAAGGSAVTVDGNAVTVDENHTADLVDVTATDPEGIHADYTFALGGTDSSSFTLNAGVLSFTNPPNYEARKVYRLRLTASNASESSTLNVTVTVGDVNESPNITGLAEVTVNEGHTGTLRTYQKSDPDRPLQTTNWGPVGSSEVLSGTDSDAFVFDQLDGSLTFASPPDFEVGGSQYQVILTANDGKLDGSLDITVNVANLEERGELTFGGVTQGANGQLLQATLTDPDGVATQTWVWQRRTGTSGSWTDIASTNAASYTPTADDVGQYLRASVTYTDGAGTNETTLTKATELPTLNDASSNEPPLPPDPLPQVGTIPENASTRLNVVRVVFTDPESEQLTYSVDSDEFEIDSRGQITVKLGAAFDHETKPTLPVTARAVPIALKPDR